MTAKLTLLSRVAYRDHEVTAPRLRALLALLAGDVRTGCSTAGLVAGLWPDEQPENPAKALQVIVSRARAQLGPDLIVSTPSGYRLALGDDQVDVSAVVLSASASAHLGRAGDHAGALAHAEAGLAYWAGSGAGDSDSAHDDPLTALRADRASTYRSLVRSRALARSRLGQRAEAVEALTRLAHERPRDEEVLLELLRCEAETVGPPAALARYDAYRRSLREELGTAPGAALRGLHQELLHHEAPAVRHGVPHEPNPLLGRDADVARVSALLRTSRVVSIVGAGGLGKTRLAHVVSRRAEQRAVHVVALAGVGADDDVVREVASVLGVGESRRTSVGQRTAATDLVGGIVNALGSGPALLVLDNCEHVLRGAAELVQALVAMSRHVRVLTTSRAPLGLSSESVHLLPRLTLPTTVELFQQRARSARPDVELPAVAVEELCRHLDGLPLAAELAAARVRVMSVAEIARRLDDRFRLLRGGPREAPPRHRTLHAVVDWSWNLLEPDVQAAMRALSVFPDGFSADAAEHLLGDQNALRLVEHLVEQSLLDVTDTPSGTRFRMLETVREFGAARRESAGENDRVVAAFLAWARDFGTSHHEAPFGADPFSTCTRIRVEQDNLLLALRHGLARTDGATVASTSAVLGALWIIESDLTRATHLDATAGALSHFRPAPHVVEVTRTAVTVSLVSSYLLHGFPAARGLVALRRLPPAPPSTVVRAAAALLSAGAGSEGPTATGLERLRDSGEPLLAGVAACFASYLWERENDLERACAAARQMLAAFPERDTPWMHMMARARLGELCLQLEQGTEAERHLVAALRVQDGFDGGADMNGIRWAIVLADLQRGAVGEAEHWLELAVSDQGHELAGMVAFSRGMRAEIALARGDVDDGLRLWRQTVEGLQDVESELPGVDADMDPWYLEVQAVAVAAHAQHGASTLVEESTGELTRRLTRLLSSPPVTPPAYLMDLAVAGTLLLALAFTDLDRGARTGDGEATAAGVRMIALAERLRYLRTFHPTMSSARVRSAAEQADRSAYGTAVSSYADLRGPAELRAAALTLLRERPRPDRHRNRHPARPWGRG